MTEPFWEHLCSSGLDLTPRTAEPAAWGAVLAGAAYVPVGYVPSMVDYQTAYHGLTDLSAVIRLEGRPIAAWPVGLGEQVSTNGGPVWPPLCVNALTERQRKQVVKGCLDALGALARSLGQESWLGEEIVGPSGASLWHRNLMERGASLRVEHELFADLSEQLSALRLALRKSYRTLVEPTGGRWAVDAISGPDVSATGFWERFRELHEEVSGRVTRSRAT